MRRARVVVLVLVLGAGCSSPPPPPREDLALLARLAALEGKLEEQERTRLNFLGRLAAIEQRLGAKPRPDDDIGARIAAIETKLALVEDKVAVVEMAKPAPAGEKREGDGSRIVDRKKGGDRPSAPAPGEVVRPLAAISGDTFSFLREGKVDLARLAGIEAPARDDEAAAAKARERLEEVLTAGEVTFEYPPGPQAPRGLTVYARVKKPGGDELLANEALLKEGLVRAQGEHPRRADFEKLEADAKAAKLGIFGR